MTTTSTTSTTATTPKLLLRDDAYYAPVDSGVFVLSHQGETFISGESAHLWLDRLAPLLDGANSADDIVADLPADRAAFVRNFLEGLVAKGLVREINTDEPHSLTPQELRAHAAEIDFVGYFRDSACRAFETFRGTPAVVIGPRDLASTVAGTCARSGLRSVHVLPTGECGVETGRFDDRLAGAGLVLHVTDRPAPLRSRWLESRCAELDIALGQLVWSEGRVWTQYASRSPWTRGWSTGWRRRAGMVPTGDRAQAPADSVAMTVAINQLVHDTFRLATGVRDPATRACLVELAPDTLASTTHTFVPHPLDLPAMPLSAAEFTERVRGVAGLPALGDDEFSRRAAAFSSDTVGLFGSFVEDDLAQLPLHVTSTSVADPMGLLRGHAHAPEVSGAGLTFEGARYRAALAALSCYASLAVDPRRLLLREGEPWHTGEMSTVDVPGAVTARVRALDLAGGEPVLVDAATVFPALHSTDEPYRAPLGTAAGYHWEQVVADGVVAHARELTLRALADGSWACPRVDPAPLAADEEIGYCLAMLEALGDELVLHDVTGPLGVPTVAAVLCGETIAYAAAPDVTGAVRNCLRDAVLARQSALNAQPVYAPPPVPELPDAVRGDTVSATEPHTVDVPTVVRALAEHGHRAVVVPLDHDPALHEAIPFIARVVLT